MVAGAGGREGARERARGQSEDGTCWENRPAFTFSVSYCSGSRCQTLSFRLGLEKEKVWVDRAKGRGADTGQAFPQGDRHPAACPGSTSPPQTGFASGTPPPPGLSPLLWELLSHPLFSVWMKDRHQNQTKHSGYTTLKEKKSSYNIKRFKRGVPFYIFIFSAPIPTPKCSIKIHFEVCI